MENEEIIIPEGWTYFAHRTNTSNWSENPFYEKSIVLKKIMSVVTEGDIYTELRRRGRDHNFGYSLGEGEPFEIRNLICTIPYISNMNDDNEMKNIMYHEFYYDKNNFGGMGGQRNWEICVKSMVLEWQSIWQKVRLLVWQQFIPLLRFRMSWQSSSILLIFLGGMIWLSVLTIRCLLTDL